MTVQTISPVSPSTQAASKLLLDVQQQMKEEIGDDILTDAQKLMLQQKYGFTPPVLDGLERNIIHQEERTSRMFPNAA